MAAILAASTLACSAASAPRTKEAYLEETDELAVRATEKEGPNQEDLDLFFKDQAHLQDHTQTQTGSGSGIFGLPFVGNPQSFMSQLADLLSVVQFFVVPPIDLNSFSQVVITAPMEVFNQFITMMHMRDQILCSSANQTKEFANHRNITAQ